MAKAVCCVTRADAVFHSGKGHKHTVCCYNDLCVVRMHNDGLKRGVGIWLGCSIVRAITHVGGKEEESQKVGRVESMYPL